VLLRRLFKKGNTRFFQGNCNFDMDSLQFQPIRWPKKICHDLRSPRGSSVRLVLRFPNFPPFFLKPCTVDTDNAASVGEAGLEDSVCHTPGTVGSGFFRTMGDILDNDAARLKKGPWCRCQRDMMC